MPSRSRTEGVPRYVGVLGRVDSTEDCEDEDDRPLVLRRRRLELRRGPPLGRRSRTSARSSRSPSTRTWTSIAVDGDALDEGLVVVTRESVGTAADLGDRVPDGTAPETPARYRLDLLSSVDHALVMGVPTMDPERGPILRPGLGRPLILTNLEPKEAIRMLAEGRRGTTRVISLLLGGGTAPCSPAWRGPWSMRLPDGRSGGRRAAALLRLGRSCSTAATTALAESPSPSPAGGGDPRSAGQGPGLVGDPLLAIGLVVLIGVVALGATLLYVRATGGSRGS